jgi:hypothetical protein
MNNVHSAPAHRVEVFHDRTGFLAGATQAEQLTHDHAVFRRAFGGGVLPVDQVGDDFLEVDHNVLRATGGLPKR